MAFSSTSTSGISSEINVTPLIDVLLVLLIIFMVIVPVAPLGLDTALPAAGRADATVAAHQPPVLVEVAGDAAHPLYRIDAVAVDGASIESKLTLLMATRAERQMVVQAVAAMDFGTVSHVVDQGRAAGAETVGLVSTKR